MIGGDAVEDELEGPGALFHLFLVSGKNYLVSAQSQRVLTLVLGRGENHDMCAHRLREFHTHVTESAQADDAHFFAGPHLGATQGRIGRDSGAKKRCRSCEIQIRRDAENEILIHHDAFRITTIGHRRCMVAVGRVVSQGHIRAEYLDASFAGRTRVIGIDEASDANEVADFELGDLRAHLGDATNDFMAGHAGINGRHHSVPFIAGLMQVRMANATEEEFDLHVAGSSIAARNGGGGEWRRLAGGRIGFGLVNGAHGIPFVRVVRETPFFFAA